MLALLQSPPIVTALQWWQLLAAVGVVALSTLGGVWAILQSDLARDIKGQRTACTSGLETEKRERTDQIRHFGERLGALEQSAQSFRDSILRLDHAAAGAAEDHASIREQVGEMREGSRRFVEQSLEGKLEIISHITEAKRDLTAMITANATAQADRDSRVMQRLMRVETVLEGAQLLRRDPKLQEGV